MRKSSPLIALLIVIAPFASNSAAAADFEKGECWVKSLRSAYGCLYNVDLQEGELKNSVGIVSVKQGEDNLSSLMEGLSEAGMLDEAEIRTVNHILAEDAAYIGVVNQHFDEDKYTYFALPWGSTIKPIELFSFSTADFYPYPLRAMPIDYALGLRNIKDWHYDEFEYAYANAESEVLIDKLDATIGKALYMSESDYPWQGVEVSPSPVASFDEAEIRKTFATSEPVSVWSFKETIEFLDYYIDENPYEEATEAKQYKDLKELMLKEFSDFRVIKVGEEDAGELKLYILGITKSKRLVGLQTIAVET